MSRGRTLVLGSQAGLQERVTIRVRPRSSASKILHALKIFAAQPDHLLLTRPGAGSAYDCHLDADSEFGPGALSRYQSVAAQNPESDTASITEGQPKLPGLWPECRSVQHILTHERPPRGVHSIVLEPRTCLSGHASAQEPGPSGPPRNGSKRATRHQLSEESPRPRP